MMELNHHIGSDKMSAVVHVMPSWSTSPQDCSETMLEYLDGPKLHISDSLKGHWRSKDKIIVRDQPEGAVSAILQPKSCSYGKINTCSGRAESITLYTKSRNGQKINRKLLDG